jgi:hypothetical protein
MWAGHAIAAAARPFRLGTRCNNNTEFTCAGSLQTRLKILPVLIRLCPFLKKKILQNFLEKNAFSKKIREIPKKIPKKNSKNLKTLAECYATRFHKKNPKKNPPKKLKEKNIQIQIRKNLFWISRDIFEEDAV